MKEFINSPENIRRIEFWAATMIFVFAVFYLLTSPIRYNYNWSPNKEFFDGVGIHYNYYSNYFFPKLFQFITLYLAFLVVNFKAVPDLIRQENQVKKSLLIAGVLLLVWLLLGVTDTYIKNHLFVKYGENTYNKIFQDSFVYALWLLLMFGFYTGIKQLGIYMVNYGETIQKKHQFITVPGIISFFVWLVSLFLLFTANVHSDIVLVWGLFSLTGILLYFYATLSLIPKSLKKKKPFRAYVSLTFLILLLSVVPIFMILLVFTLDEEAAIGLSFFNAIFHLFITVPFAWVLYKRQMKDEEKITLLRRELNHSNANFDFLRSQINPHFLFNALNTIYGTAIQEKAERTGEGIEKLGDMMRFMIQENMQEKISLAREIEYLNNYIGLQRLRTDSNPKINITTQIEEPVNTYEVSPMLLIPFVENAFKHGISFKEPSHISVNLEIKDDKLYFDVHNSKHQKQEHDPEKYNSGIGLNNVKQRLEMLYKKQHELIIRETGKEYFVHLTINLS